MKTILTTNDICNFIGTIFAENSEPIGITNEYSGEREEKDIAKYLNIKFYAWKNRVIEKGDDQYINPMYMDYDTWVQSLNLSMDESYALVEMQDEEVTVSKDIDSCNKIGQITFLVQSDKMTILDYYLHKLRNQYLGNTFIFQNSNGDKLKAFMLLGVPIYEEEPIQTQLGECIVVKCNFQFTYINNAETYADYEISFSVGGEFTFDEQGNTITKPTFSKVILSKMTPQLAFIVNPITVQDRPDLTGSIASASSSSFAISFFDFENDFIDKLNDIFWSQTSFIKNDKLQNIQNVQVPIYMRVENKNNVYIYKCLIESITKTITNNDFVVTNLSLKLWGKRG